eukprot:CAMPEP_0205916854 /NCGR_PEP_ID=MMETSP1325-20131115/8790_1 /ASSEMBLY_ACC=CAM_ASM_000708 /TAXON_ID=236786 /ORGANISM="Florenciella sp., Strain RCC1007" /LENGTH=39 /DNA_ID= /DNA_START= /DNA_END= /DNA_ORIENTATION=
MVDNPKQNDDTGLEVGDGTSEIPEAINAEPRRDTLGVTS